MGNTESYINDYKPLPIPLRLYANGRTFVIPFDNKTTRDEMYDRVEVVINSDIQLTNLRKHDIDGRYYLTSDIFSDPRRYINIQLSLKYIPKIIQHVSKFSENRDATITMLIMLGIYRVESGKSNGDGGTFQFINSRPYGPVFRDVGGNIELLLFRYIPDDANRDAIINEMGRVYCNTYPSDPDCRCVMRHSDPEYIKVINSLVYNPETLMSDSCWYIPCKNAKLYIRDPSLEKCDNNVSTCSIKIDANKLGGDLSIYNNTFDIKGCHLVRPFAPAAGKSGTVGTVGKVGTSESAVVTENDTDGHIPEDSKPGDTLNSSSNTILFAIGTLLLIIYLLKA